MHPVESKRNSSSNLRSPTAGPQPSPSPTDTPVCFQITPTSSSDSLDSKIIEAKPPHLSNIRHLPSQVFRPIDHFNSNLELQTKLDKRGHVWIVKDGNGEEFVFKTSERRAFGRELTVLSKCKHPNLVRFFGQATIQMPSGKMASGFLLEKAEEDLFSLLKKNHPLEEQQIKRILRDILLGLQYLHKENFAHRDLKAGNVLCFKNGVYKLADFGFTKKISEEKGRHTPLGTPTYAAPEIFPKQGEETSEYSKKADLFSLGALLFYTAYKKSPLGKHGFLKKTEKLNNFVKTGQISYPKNPARSNELKALISRLMQKEPENRPSFQEILQHPWMES